MFALETEALSRDFKKIRALDGVNLQVPAGAIFGFLGPNGAGKTTMIRLLLGLLRPTAGKARVLGFDTAAEAGAIRERTGALLEHAGIYERLTAEENLEFFARIYQQGKTERKSRIQELLAHFGLYDRRRDRAGTWSRGMKQKLAIARTLVHRPQVVFLDEPTASLDPVAAAGLREDISNLARREGVTVFLTTHNLAEAEKVCTLVGVVRQGKLLAVGSPDELRRQSAGNRAIIHGSGFTPELSQSLANRPEIAQVTVADGRLNLELRSEVSLAPIVRLLVEGGAAIEEIQRPKASLEEVFLSLVGEES